MKSSIMDLVAWTLVVVVLYAVGSYLTSLGPKKALVEICSSAGGVVVATVSDDYVCVKEIKL